MIDPERMVVLPKYSNGEAKFVLVGINEGGGNSPILSVGVGGYLCAATMPDGHVRTVLVEVGKFSKRATSANNRGTIVAKRKRA